LFAGYQATVDWPGAYVWRDLADHFTEAKILLSNRDSASWYRSMDKTILDAMRNSTDPESIGMRLKQNVLGGNITDKDHVIATFEKNVADVQAAFGPDRLLTFNIGDGWAPLCEFLNCAVPDQPFPHSNKPDEFNTKLNAAETARGGEV